MDDDKLHTLTLLVAELAAIELLDAQLWLDGSPYGYDIVAFVQRRNRRREIIPQLADILAPREGVKSRRNLAELGSGKGIVRSLD